MNSRIESLLLDLQQRVKKLEEENTELKRWLSREKKKVNITQWLIEHWAPRADFFAWQKNIDLTIKDLEKVFRHGLSTGVCYIIQRYLPIAHHTAFPIIGFKQRGFVFYIYNEDKWRVMQSTELDKLIRDINTKLFLVFNEWEKENEAMLKTEEGKKVYHRNLKKILLLPDKLDSTIKKIRNRLFQYLHIDLKNVTEFEFSF